MLITHHWPPKGNARSYQLHLAKYCGIAVALAGSHRSLYCTQTFEHLLRAEDTSYNYWIKRAKNAKE